jgi:hypothetical protein
MNLFIQFFAAVFAKFKQKNPAIAGIIALVLIVAVYTAEQGTALGIFTLPSWAAEAVKTVSLLLLALNGAHTSQYVGKG